MDTPREERPDAETPEEAAGAESFPETPIEEPAAEPGAASDELPALMVVEAPEPKKESGFRRLLYNLFSPETRAGRVMRPFLRGAALAVGAFALGMLATYLMIFRPANEQLQSTRAELAAARQQLTENETALMAAQTTTGELNERVDQMEQDMKAAAARVHLLLVTKEVKNAQIALANQDGPAAQEALEAAKAQLDAVFLDLLELNPNSAEGIKLRLDLVLQEYATDPDTAMSDLDILNTNLSLLDEELAELFD